MKAVVFPIAITMLEFLMRKMTTPLPFGPFHLSFIAVFVLLIPILLIFFRKSKDKTFRIIIAIAWVIIVILEITKQIIWGFDKNGGKYWSFCWWAFPYQFCSLPFYLWPFVIFLKDSKFKTVLNVFLSTFVLFGGLGYLFVVGSFCEYVWINVQTLVHHGLQVCIGILIFVHEYDKFDFKKFLQSILFLLGSVALAIILNVIVTKSGNSVNYFELNPLEPTTVPFFSDILKQVGYPVYLLLYLFGFIVFADLCYWIIKGVIELSRHIKPKTVKA